MNGTAPKKRSIALPVILALAATVACVPCTGILAAIAIPAFISYTRRAKTAEAHANLPQIARAVSEAYAMERAPTDGAAVSHVLPPALGPTPPIPTQARQIGAFAAEPGWAALGFAPSDPLYYSYEYTPDADGRGFVVRARGDLDGDGILSLFEIRGNVDSAGDVTLDPIAMTHELE